MEEYTAYEDIVCPSCGDKISKGDAYYEDKKEGVLACETCMSEGDWPEDNFGLDNDLLLPKD